MNFVPSQNRLVIIGAGHAGGRAAEALRAAGYAGSITLIGEERHPPYERPPLSKELLEGSIGVEKTYLKPAESYAEAGIELILGRRVDAIDRASATIRLADGDTLPYDQLLLTTGARARRLALPGGTGSRLRYLRDIEDTLALREDLLPDRRVVVIGAGFIGLEAAAAARRRGAAVTVLEAAPHPLGRVVAPEIGDWFARLHRQHGTEIRCGIRILAIEDDGPRSLIRLADGETLAADLVVAGIGARPNDELAAAAGVAVDDGVLVDAFGRSSDPAIFAAGDVTRHFNPILGRHIRLEAWQNAQNQAIAVARIMAGGSEPHAEVPWFWTDQHGVNLQIAGAPLAWDRLVWRGLPGDRAFSVFYLAAGRPVAANAINSGRDMRFMRQLIARGEPVDPAQLADPAVKLQALCRG